MLKNAPVICGSKRRPDSECMTLKSFLKREGAAIGAVGSDGVESVGHGEDSGADGNLLGFQAAQITAAIETLVMRANQFRGIREKGNLFDQVKSDLHVTLHEHAFFVGEGTWFEENAIGESKFADVVEVSAHCDGFVLALRKAHHFCYFQSETTDAAGVPFGCGVTKINGGAQGFEGVFIAAFYELKGGFNLMGALRDHLFQMQTIAFDFALKTFFLEGAMEAGNDQFFLQGLHKIVVRARLHGLYSHAHIIDASGK